MQTPIPNHAPFRLLSDEWRTELQFIANTHVTQNDPAHDSLHVRRVAALAEHIGARENANPNVVVPAALLHELVSHPKGSPRSAQSGEDCAQKAAEILVQMACPSQQVDAICACIRVHSFSRGIVPQDINAQTLQDADRLDAIGAIGIARCFATGTTMQRSFYHPQDPFCQTRVPDDATFTLDHFYTKLLRLPQTLHTETARALAESRAAFLRDFLEHLAQEIGIA